MKKKNKNVEGGIPSSLYETFFRSIDAPIYIINTDDFTIAATNEQKGNPIKPGEKCYRHFHGLTEPCGRHNHRCALEEVRQYKGKVVLVHEYQDEEGAEKATEIHAYPIFNDEGVVVQVAKYLKDVTAERDRQRSIKEKAVLLETLLNNTPGATFVINLNREIAFANDSIKEITGYETAELTGKPYALFIDSINLEDFNIIFANTKDYGKRISSHELLIRRKGGGYRNVLANIFPLYNAHHAVIGVTVTMVDISSHKETADLLIRAEERWRTFADYVPDLILNVNEERTILFLNQALGGIKPEDAIGTDFIDYIHPAYRKTVNQALADLFKSGNVQSAEVLAQGKTAEGYFWRSMRIGAISVNKEVVAATIIAHDIDERKKIEEQLHEQQEYTRNLIESSLDMIISVDENRHIVEFNTAAEKTFGYSRKEVIGKHIGMLYADLSESAKPVKKLSSETGFSGEVLNKKITGETFTSYLSANHLHNKKGEFIGIMGISRDISRQKEVEAALRRMERSIEFADFCIMMTDIEGTLHYVNPAFQKMTGYSTREAIGKKTNILKSGLTQLQTYKELWATILSGKPWRGELVNKRKNGSFFDAMLVIAPVFTNEGHIEGFIAVCDDITKQKEAAKALKKSLAEKEVLLKEIHHRVKNNMQIVQSLLSIQSGYIEEERYQDIFRDCRNRIRSMSLIHENLYRSGDLSHVHLENYINKLLKDLFFSYSGKKDRIALVTDIEKTDLDIDVAIPCGLIINELITNAIKYAFPGERTGEISLKIKNKSKNLVVMTVKDNGVGIPKEIDHKKPTTLGLQLVTSLGEEQLGGTVTLKRKGGTTFEVRFNKNRHKRG